jgi:hypothetical protein
MTTRVFSLAIYRLRATFCQRWGGYLAVVLLIGLVGGLSMGAIAGARRTQSAFPTYLATTDASNLRAQIWNLQESLLGPASANLTKQLARLPDVQHVVSAPALIVVPLKPNGKPIAAAPAIYGDEVNIDGSVGGMYFHQDRVSVARGRLADPRRADEMDATAAAARILGWHVGEKVTFGAYSLQQTQIASFNPSAANAKETFTVKLVGLIVFSSQVSHDDVDRYPTEVLLTPALTQRLPSSATLPVYGLRLKHGNKDVASVERAIIHMVPKGTIYAFHLTSIVTGQVQRASKPEAFALGVFGIIAALAALLIAGLTISRRLWSDGEDLNVLRALGASSVSMTLEATLGLLGAVVLGTLTAFGVAVLLSPLAPLGPVRQVDSSSGFAFDWTVLGVGVAVLTVGLVALTLALAHRQATRGSAQRREPIERRSNIVNLAARTGLPIAALVGLRFSLRRGHGRTSVPVRSVLVGAVLAVVVVAATVTFGSSLSTLNSHPALYGWNWNDALASGAGGSVPPTADQLLNHDSDVAAWTGFGQFTGVQIDGQTVPGMDASTHASLGPPILSGHALDATNQVVVGAATLVSLRKKVGDTVYFSYGSRKDAPVYVPPTPVTIVGTATFPAIGTSGTSHPSMGIGVLYSSNIGPAAFHKAISSPDPNLNGPNIVVVRFRSGVSPEAGRATLNRIARAASKVLHADPNNGAGGVSVVGVQRPAEMIAYQSTGATPAILAGGLVAGAVVALGLALASSVRRRRRELALLKALGFTQRQLSTAVAWQASVTALIGVIVGVPAGVLLGRWLWILFAREIYAVPDPSVPVLQLLFIVLGAILLANLVAAIPGRIASRTSTALVLRAE